MDSHSCSYRGNKSIKNYPSSQNTTKSFEKGNFKNYLYIHFWH